MSLVVLCVYVLWAVRVWGGVPSSVSATYYRLGERGLYFQCAMLVSGGLLMPAMLEVLPDGMKWLGFLGCGGVLMVGVSPRFRDDFEGRVHAVGAGLLLLCALCVVGLYAPWLLSLWVGLGVWLVARYLRARWVVVSLVSFLRGEGALFWLEVVAIVSTYVTLFGLWKVR